MRTILRRVTRPFTAFSNRAEAGRALAAAVALVPDPEARVLAVPRGGVEVALPLAEALGAPLELAMVRKLPMPYSPEAGFGAVALDGSVVLNEPLVRELGLLPSQISPIVQEVLAEVRRRAKEYAGHDRPPDVGGRRVYVVDDGLASGYTMIAAAKMVRKREPARMALCVPVSPRDSLDAVEPYFDEMHCLIEQERPPFAVASFYARFNDLTDAEVRAMLKKGIRPDRP